ncbi:MAG: bifunctional DNA-formamidopyrimidine glycosylase/DNA-(apurinic or apyrimidinic site) lyase [Pyrinomonadaceae bacterium]|nr:bifunctional DNA-formamidopyrimidine glycosylase/DNA-(apurinic or apyrimidinic site) lyase [Phycisphaerales bacterium]
MPELPEVECLRRSLLPHLIGNTITSASLLRPDMLEIAGEAPTRPARGVSRSVAALLLQGCRITALRRHGKQLALLGTQRSRSRVLVFHLGMSGQVKYLSAGEPVDSLTHVHARWLLDSGGRLAFRDPRRFGGMWAISSESDLNARWAELGPDALTIQSAPLAKALASSRRAIKAVLLDQAVLAGVGNIYADEALFRSRLHPLTPAESISAVDVTRLAKEIRGVLANAIKAGGSTLNDYFDANGKPGGYQARRWVYDRAGKPCRVCKAELSHTVVAQRTTTWCPRCQPHYRS